MRRRRTSGLLAVLGALLVVVLGATAAAAQVPEKEVIPIDVTFDDEFLTEACGVPVTTTITGQVTIFTFPDGTVLQELTTLNLAIVATAGDNQARFRDVGIDEVRVQPDGTVILSMWARCPLDSPAC